jgi:tetraprenyl-beta-curcumene synthase
LVSRHRRPAALVATADMVAALGRYTATIAPRARAEIARWRPRAQRIPDEQLRGLALSTLGEEALNAEAAAVFALLAPRRARRQVVDLLVAWQLMFDYLDTITERDRPDPLADSLRLHGALVESVMGAGPPAVEHDDGGYLRELVATCRRRLWALPAAGAVAAVVAREAGRCGAAQSHTHAAMLRGQVGELRAWARAEQRGGQLEWARADERGGPLEWWETAAAGISSLRVHALLAAAADPRTTAMSAQRTARAYTEICALSTLLDSLVDLDADNRSGNLSYFAQYPSPAAAASGMRRLAARSRAGASRLPLGRVHRVIVAGLAGFYLSDEGARANPAAVAAGDAVARQLAPAVQPALALLRVRRALAG